MSAMVVCINNQIPGCTCVNAGCNSSIFDERSLLSAAIKQDKKGDPECQGKAFFGPRQSQICRVREVCPTLDCGGTAWLGSYHLKLSGSKQLCCLFSGVLPVTYVEAFRKIPCHFPGHILLRAPNHNIFTIRLMASSSTVSDEYITNIPPNAIACTEHKQFHISDDRAVTCFPGTIPSSGLSVISRLSPVQSIVGRKFQIDMTGALQCYEIRVLLSLGV